MSKHKIKSYLVPLVVTSAIGLYVAEAFAANELDLINKTMDGLTKVAKEKGLPFVEMLILGAGGYITSKTGNWWSVLGATAAIAIIHFTGQSI
jgi:prepilin signal peptidase PulO-like enzyme (type II secretory pathway)